MTVQATIITTEPIIEVIAEQALNREGILNMAKWVERYRPQCVPEGGFQDPLDLVPHSGLDISPDQSVRQITDNELLAELAGRKCYDSFAEAGTKRSNSAYLRSMWEGKVPHRSTGYHAKMTFFIAHVSRRVSHELIRNYVGSDRDEEGSPSQESTRYTEHPGVYIAHPRYLEDPADLARFSARAQKNYEEYRETLSIMTKKFVEKTGAEPKGLQRKRLYEAAAGDLLMCCGTSFIWTTNPMALLKLFMERGAGSTILNTDNESADMEMIRLARAWKKLCLNRWPNLFPTLTTL